MDVELLINLVYDKPAIWQSRHKNHFNRGLIDKMWDEIALTLETTNDAARTKWKSLKDCYRKELKKLMKKTSGSGGSELKTSRWPFFSLLHFIKDEITGGNLEQSIKAECSINTFEDFLNLETDPMDGSSHFTEDDAVNEDMGSTTADEGTPVERNTITTRKRKETVQDTVAKKMFILEENTNDLLSKHNLNPEDLEDYYFLMSLLPHLKPMGPLQKLRVRNKLTQVFIDEAERVQRISTHSADEEQSTSRT